MSSVRVVGKASRSGQLAAVRSNAEANIDGEDPAAAVSATVTAVKAWDRPFRVILSPWAMVFVCGGGCAWCVVCVCVCGLLWCGSGRGTGMGGGG